MAVPPFFSKTSFWIFDGEALDLSKFDTCCRVVFLSFRSYQLLFSLLSSISLDLIEANRESVVSRLYFDFFLKVACFLLTNDFSVMTTLLLLFCALRPLPETIVVEIVGPLAPLTTFLILWLRPSFDLDFLFCFLASAFWRSSYFSLTIAAASLCLLANYTASSTTFCSLSVIAFLFNLIISCT